MASFESADKSLMNNGVIGQDNHFIFYLKTTKELPADYFRIASYLNNYKITVLPINIDEYINLKSDNSKFCFMLNNTLESKVIVDKFREKFFKLTYAFSSHSLVEISGFEIPDYAKKNQGMMKYYSLCLPEKIDHVCKKLAALYYRDILKKSTWPGGTKARLPKDLTKKNLYE